MSFRLTWKQEVSYKKPGFKKKLKKIREHEAFFISEEAALKAITMTPEELKCFDFEIKEVA